MTSTESTGSRLAAAHELGEALWDAFKKSDLNVPTSAQDKIVFVEGVVEGYRTGWEARVAEVAALQARAEAAERLVRVRNEVQDALVLDLNRANRLRDEGTARIEALEAAATSLTDAIGSWRGVTLSPEVATAYVAMTDTLDGVGLLSPPSTPPEHIEESLGGRS